MNKFLHRWFGLLASVFILLFALSGIVLNHRSLFSGVDINRKYLPADNQFHNWNLSAVKSATTIGSDSLLMYGNIGIWLTDSTMTSFTPFWNGMKKGADNRRTTRIIKTKEGEVFAGTMNGLYALKKDTWQLLQLPGAETRITGIAERGDSVLVTTRSQLFALRKTGENILVEEIVLPYPSDFKRETTLFRALWVIHSGKILGTTGKLFVDFMGLTMIFLSLTGIIWFVAPDMMKALKKRITLRKRIIAINKFSYKWHNKVGIWMLAFLILLTLTGMFLRPPLLIAIVQSKFPAVRFTILDHPNPWYDKLRDIQYNRKSGEFLLSTSEGFYTAEPTFTDSLQPVPIQPPISVMGINVFEQPSDGIFLTGSFSGIHLWNPSTFQIKDYITGVEVSAPSGMAHPFGNVPVAGYIKNSGAEYIFDYNAGVFSLTRGHKAPEMPLEVIDQTPMPLWNLALEIHTARFYSFFLGKYYILFIPLMGLVILTVLITGGIRWLKLYNRKKNHLRK